ncbi:MAG: cyclopropane-fatty-acyl-phospholipid synthase [Planctomycetota bacterium]|jgi:cyclopropane-fatty-acyl-phospholipid synthase
MIGQALLSSAINQMERGRIPDSLIRWGIRRLCKTRLKEETAHSLSGEMEGFIRGLPSSPIAVETDSANEQHYELPAEFFQLVLGENRKYSGCYFPAGTNDLDTAEKLALEETCARAQIKDGMKILELGCGWGSLTLWMARHFPNCQITAVSNSQSQREFIEALAASENLTNVTIVTADMNEFSTDKNFDRVVSVEMFEHMRNYRVLLERISDWLSPHGLLFVHIFCHREFSYPFETEGNDDWMGKYFFTGGIMPGENLLDEFQEHMSSAKKWVWNGEHYEKTSNAWLENMDSKKPAVMKVLRATYGDKEAALWFQRWRVFFMACAELFGFDGGKEWYVSHTLYERTADKKALSGANG